MIARVVGGEDDLAGVVVAERPQQADRLDRADGHVEGRHRAALRGRHDPLPDPLPLFRCRVGGQLSEGLVQRGPATLLGVHGAVAVPDPAQPRAIDRMAAVANQPPNLLVSHLARHAQQAGAGPGPPAGRLAVGLRVGVVGGCRAGVGGSEVVPAAGDLTGQVLIPGPR
jgi:hypothetical protein